MQIKLSAGLWLVALIFHTKLDVVIFCLFNQGFVRSASLLFKLSVCIFTYLIYKHIIWNDWICVVSRLKATKTLMMALLRKGKMKIQRILIFKLVNLVSLFIFIKTWKEVDMKIQIVSKQLSVLDRKIMSPYPLTIEPLSLRGSILLCTLISWLWIQSSLYLYFPLWKSGGWYKSAWKTFFCWVKKFQESRMTGKSMKAHWSEGVGILNFLWTESINGVL